MDIILLLVGAWWLSGVLGCRKRKPKRRKSSIWKPDLDVYDWEQHQKSNRRYGLSTLECSNLPHISRYTADATVCLIVSGLGLRF